MGRQISRREMANINCARDIILAGFVSEEEKWELLKDANVFFFRRSMKGSGCQF